MEVQPHSVKCYISVRSNVNISFGRMLNDPFPVISFHQVFNGAGEGAGSPRKSIHAPKPRSRENGTIASKYPSAATVGEMCPL